MPVPDFSPGEVLTAAAMDSIGLWLVKTVTVGTTVSSVPVASCFSADYDAYQITYTGGVSSTGTELSVQLDGITTGYYGSAIFASYGASGVLNNQFNNVTLLPLGRANTGALAYCHIGAYISNPFLTTQTMIRADFLSGNVNMGFFLGRTSSTTSTTGFTITTSAGTITGGTIRVYGYRN
jgi:hypothetical protein